MTDAEAIRDDAQHAVRTAQQLEEAGRSDDARTYWLRARKLYTDAGLDPGWYDDDRMGELEAYPTRMDARQVFPTTDVELTYDSDAEEPTGVVCDVEDLVPIQR